jgi:hypothetical protein
MYVPGRLPSAAIAPSRGWLLALILLVVGVASLALSSLPLVSPAAPLAEVARPVSRSAAPAALGLPAPAPNPAASHTCVVSGDLVGDANPAQVAAALCRP